MKDDDEYTKLNITFGNSPLDFMNHGYAPSLNIIDDEDYIFKNQISLYLQMFDNIDMKNKNILEIGCGRGGGISAIQKYLNPKELYACDLNYMNIEYCINNQNKDIKFKQCNAHSLDYPDNFFDVVINIESSHSYQEPDLFFKEVVRVLKHDGIFLYADTGNVIQEFMQYFKYFKKIIREDITKNIEQSCREDYDKFDKMITNKDLKKVYMDIAKSKAIRYSLVDDDYIKYIGYKER